MKSINRPTSVALDFLRMLSAQAVLVGHVCVAFFVDPLVPAIHKLGVVVFFLLSGFLISHTLERKRGASYGFGTYFGERFFRIYSALIPALLLIVVIDGVSQLWMPRTFTGYNTYTLRNFVGNVLMLEDLPQLHVASFGTAESLWTLPLEWWSYLTIGFFVLVPRRLRSVLWWELAVLASIIPLVKILYDRQNAPVYAWWLGVVVYLCWRRWRWRGGLILMLGGFGAAYAYAIYARFEFLFLVYLTMALGFLGLLWVLERVTLTIPPRVEHLVRRSADYSYTLYLIHVPLVALGLSIVRSYGVNPFAMSLIVIVGANVGAFLLAQVTEMRHKAMRQAVLGWFRARAILNPNP